MKVLIVSVCDISGGASRAAFRLHDALVEQKVDSFMLVQNKRGDDPRAISPKSYLEKISAIIRPFLDKIPIFLYKNRSLTLFSPSWLSSKKLVETINKLSPDIVHLHWINNGFLGIDDLKGISAPIVWSLHDMWAFTGGCHYDEHCNAFVKSCGSCKVLRSNSQFDLSRYLWAKKNDSLKSLPNLKVVGLSRWLAYEAKRSSIFQQHEVINLPNPINTKKFSPFDKMQARDLLNLPRDKPLLLYGAMNALGDPRKGYDFLLRALELIDINIELVVFGSSRPADGVIPKQKTYFMGQLSDDVSLRALYSAVDVMIVPSIQENLSNAIMESMACATPVVAFEIGGNGDLVEHKENGYLAKPFDSHDLARGIDWVLKHKNYHDLCIQARKKVVQCFDSKVVAHRYIELYQSVLTNQ